MGDPRPAVFLDRDGVLNDVVLRSGVVSSPRTAVELSVPAGAADAIGRLAAAGLTLVVVTNQPDVSRGLLPEVTLADLHERLGRVYNLAGFFVCPHERHDGCGCRKPAPGLLKRAAEDLDLRLDLGSWVLGDRWADIAAGAAVGVRTALLARPWSWEPVGGLDAPDQLVPDLSSPRLRDLVDAMLHASDDGPG